MTEAAMESDRSGLRLGTFRYLQPSVASSLYRNGKVLTRRDRDGSDSGRVGVDLEDREMAIVDARTLALAEQPTLAANGFELVERPTADPDLDFLDHDSVVRSYYPECAGIVRAATGAATVAAFDHNVRSATGKSGNVRIDGGQHVQGPAHLVHGDYTLTSAPPAAARPRAPPDPERHLPHRACRRRDPARRRGGRAGNRERALRDRQRLAQHRPRPGRDPAARPVRRGKRASRGARRLRNPLRGPGGRELLRQARSASPLGLLVRDDPRRGAPHQAVGTRRGSWPAPGAPGPMPMPTPATGPAPSASTAPSRIRKRPPTPRTAGASRSAAPPYFMGDWEFAPIT